MIGQVQLKLGLVIANRDLYIEVKACLEETSGQIVLDQATIDDWNIFLDKLEQVRPDVLLLDLTKLEGTFEETLRRVKASSAAPMIIAVNLAADPETILAAIRAGANEYLYPPVKSGLQKALVRVSAEHMKRAEAKRSQSKALGFFSAKGGCGATTIACHVASELQRVTEGNILLADFDLDSGVLGFLMKAKSGYSVLDAVRNTHRLDFSYWKALVSNGQPRLDIIGAPVMAALRESMPPAEQFRHVIHFAKSAYDWVIIDLGRNLNLLTLNLLDEIDQAYLVATLDVLALHQAKQVVQTLLDYGYNRRRLHLILNRMPKQADLTPSEVQKVLGLPVSSALPNSYPELYEAYSEGKLLGPNTELGKQLGALVRKIAGIRDEPEKPKTPKSRLSIF